MTDWTKAGNPSITHGREQSCCCCRYAWAVRDQLETALLDLVKKLDECGPYISSAFINTYHIRGRDYDGPNYGEELKQARDVLGVLTPKEPT